jgi:prepilin-type N-terminal cleavage/methylation domain-containing protein
MHNFKKTSKRGFTLLETMLSVALLLIVSLVAYEGFSSTMSYAADTALAERMSNENAGEMYDKVSAVTNGSKVTAKNAAQAIYIDGGAINTVYQVTPLKGDSGISHLTGTALMQDSDFVNTATRHGFYYTCRNCGKHTEPLQYFEEYDGSTKVIVGKCPHKDGSTQCSYKITIATVG